MTTNKIDLTAGEFKVVGNKDDDHTFRLNNPTGQILIDSSGQYEAEFTSSSRVRSDVTVDESQASEGTLSIPITIANGTYRVRRLNPVRTLLVLEVEAK